MTSEDRAEAMLLALEQMRDKARDKAKASESREDMAKWEALSDALHLLKNL